MPNRLFVLNDERIHGVWHGQDRELCALDPLEMGDFFVLAKGELHGLHVSFNVRLTVFRFGGDILGTDDYGFWSTPDVESSTLAISVAKHVPFEGSAGSPGSVVPPKPRAAVSVHSISSSGYGTVSNIKIAAFELDRGALVETTIPADPAFVDTAAEMLLRMRGPAMPPDLRTPERESIDQPLAAD